MDQPYSFAADWLDKFHQASDAIQALWILMIMATVLGVAWIVTRGAIEILLIRRAGASGPASYTHYDERLSLMRDTTPALSPPPSTPSTVIPGRAKREPGTHGR